MAWFSKLSPVPAFPKYSGKYAVGSCDVEIPVSELDAPSPAPDADIPTVAFRIFYPCEPASSSRAVKWIPGPQRGYVAAYVRFLGANSTVAETFAHFPQLLYYVTIPVHRNARIVAAPTSSKRWPVLFFSHGLGGSRNAYSHFCGSLASHGIVVIAPDHRDGSSPISYIRATNESKATTVSYKTLPHTPSAEVYEARDEQLKVRLWEMGLIHDAILKIDGGNAPTNLDPNSDHWRKKDKVSILDQFRDQLNVHRPGSITFSGHSFGAATVIQLLKSTFWQPSPQEAQRANYTPLFTPHKSSALAEQLTPETPIALLDPWCLPLRSLSTRWLWDKPLPCYTASGPGGTAVLSILSEAFFKWGGNLRDAKRVLSESPASNAPGRTKPEPYIFYPATSAHLSQSDFGVLFPWLTKRLLKADEPERTLKLNIRAVLQVMRDRGIEVAETSAEDMEVTENVDFSVEQDRKILRTDGAVPGWIAVSVEDGKDKSGTEKDAKSEQDKVVEDEVLRKIRKITSSEKHKI